jgi:hypothetical protein
MGLGSGMKHTVHIPDPGSRAQTDTRSRVLVRTTAYGRHVPDILMLLQRLVESKDDLAVGETVQGLTLLLHPLHRPFLQTEDKKHGHYNSRTLPSVADADTDWVRIQLNSRLWILKAKTALKERKKEKFHF